VASSLPPGTNLVKAYGLFRKISRYPGLTRQMRSTFLDVLVERGLLAGRQALEDSALAWMREEGTEDSPESREEYENALVDLLFASALSPEEVENYINLVRKRDRCQELGRVTNYDHATSDAIFKALKEFCDIPKGEIYISPEEAEGIRVSLISYYVSSQLPFVGIAKKYVTIRDVYDMLEHTIGHLRYPGRLGGKTAGMVVAQKILLPILAQRDPDFERHIRVPDTWYITSGVLSDFIDRNSFFFAHTHKYRDRESLDAEYQRIGALFESAAFPPDIVAEFRKLIEEIGEHPIIVRSSSYLEDSFGLAFSGKYQSVFLPNLGDADARLAAFMRGVKQVLSSMYGPDPILYRRDHGLLDYNERMSVIVQKVVGRRFGDWFFPFAAGVLFSYNSYSWNPKLKKEDGLVRLVFGLGTRAVDRVGSDYPRMIPLSHPQLRPEVTADQICRYSQKMVDVINLRTGTFETVDFRTLARETAHPDLFHAASILKEGELTAPLFRTQDLAGSTLCLTFENFIARSPFVPLVKKVLSRVQQAYGHHVDIEFAWDGESLYILQCRALSTRREMDRIRVPEAVLPEDTLFLTATGLSNALIRNIEYVVYVDPRAYDRLDSPEKKRQVGRVVGEVNRRLGDKAYALLGPGRWGSNDLNLGVRVTYADINNTQLLVEIAFARDGYTPEVSYGTHFFQDLVEADIAIMPLYPDNPGCVLREDWLLGCENRLAALDPALAEHQGVVHVIHVPSVRSGQYLHVYLDGEGQKGAGFFEAPTPAVSSGH
jgi:hypothetical protein